MRCRLGAVLGGGLVADARRDVEHVSSLGADRTEVLDVPGLRPDDLEDEHVVVVVVASRVPRPRRA